MFLPWHSYSILIFYKLEERNKIILHKLRSDWSAKKAGKFVCAKGKILFNLYNAQLVFSTFCLNGDNVVRASLIYADINLVRLNLTHTRYGRAQMILQGIACNPRKYINQAIISKLS